MRAAPAGRVVVFGCVGMVFIAGLRAVFAGDGASDRAIELAKPSPEQIAWHDMEVGMFIHFAPNTWQDEEGDKRTTPLDKLNPDKLDTDQWVRVAQAMGAGYIIFVAKHIGGFCMWQTDTSPYGVKNTPWRGGKGDVMKDLSESCRKAGIKLGVYLSPRDDTLGADTGGRCPNVRAQEAYNRVYRQQLAEVLSRYGELFEVWFDGGQVIEVGDILRRYAPKAMVFQGKYATIRWVGNEDGIAPYPAWNAVSHPAAIAGGGTAQHGDPNGTKWLPLECDARIRDTWFWNTKNADKLKTVDQLMDMYYRSVGHGAVLLLNHTPDPTGLIPEADARRAAEFGAEIKRRFGKSLAETRGQGDVLELPLPASTRIDHVVSMEDIAHGERIREYVIEGKVEKAWKEICKGTAIGHKKIDRIEPIEVSAVRLRCTRSAAMPMIRRLAVYHVGGMR